jgi:hypothetical protein
MDVIEKEDFIKKIKNFYIIITQPINENYKNTNYLHTEIILKNVNPQAKIIIPLLYFNFYHW